MLKNNFCFFLGKIALMRYHTEYRGGKIMNAQSYGAIGAILYTDPMEYASDGLDHGL